MDKKIPAYVVGVLIFLLIGGIVGIIILIGLLDLTNREAAFLTVVLTVFSILTSWLLTHLYTGFQHKKALEEIRESYDANLKTYAKQAAEKVYNLSNELDRLSKYLDLELENHDFNTPEENILSRDERITSAIHIINTLKSVNDTALSDWRGVIGDFIDEKRDSILEQQEDREEALKDILDRIEILHESQKGQNIGQGLIQRDIKENIELLQKRCFLKEYQEWMLFVCW